MSNTNWFKGIDEGLSTPGGTQVALAGYYFVDVINGDDVNGDGSPDNPWATLTFALTQNISSSNYVLAEGTYNETNLTGFNGDTILSNSNRGVIISSGTISHNSTFEGCVFSLSTLSTSNIDITLNDCVLGGVTLDIDTLTLNRSICLNPTFTIANASTWNYSTINGTGTVVMSSDITVTNCDIDEAITFSGSNNALLSFSNNRATDQTNITDNGDNIDLDPLYSNPDNLEFNIPTTSPLIGAGENNTTIGAFKLGELVDLSSPTSNNGVTDGDPITTSNEYSNLVTAWKTYSQIRKSPIITQNGLPEFQAAPTPKFALDSENRTLAPFSQTVEVTYRQTVGGSDVTKQFLVGVPALQDASGRTTGEDDFDIFDISSTGDFNNLDNLTASNLIDFAERQINVELPDKGYGNALEGSLGSETLTETGLSISNNDANDKVLQFVFFVDVLTVDSADYGGAVAEPIDTSNVSSNSKVICDIRSSTNNPNFTDILNLRTQITTSNNIAFTLFGRVNANVSNQPRVTVTALLPKKTGRYLVIGHMNLDGVSGDFNIGAINIDGFDTDEGLISKNATDRADIEECNFAGSGFYKYLDGYLLRGSVADCLPFGTTSEMENTLKSLFRAGAGSRKIQKDYSSAILERWNFDETSGTTANGENSLIDLTLNNYSGTFWVAAD